MFDGDLVVFAAVGSDRVRGDALREAWRPHVAGEVVVHRVACTHDDMLSAASLDGFGARLGRALALGSGAGVRRFGS